MHYTVQCTNNKNSTFQMMWFNMNDFTMYSPVYMCPYKHTLIYFYTSSLLLGLQVNAYKAI